MEGDGGGGADVAGRRWIPIATAEAGMFTVAAVIDELVDRVHIGAGVRLHRVSEGGIGVDVEAFVPMFATARGDASAPVDPILLGGPGADVEVDLALDLPEGQLAGGVGLESARLGGTIPSAPGAAAAFRLALHGLRLPGAAPRDIVVDAAGEDELDDAVLDLLLGLVRALAADANAGSPLAGLAAMLGLAADRVPDFPIAELRARGTGALADWLAAALSDPASRGDWLGGLAALLGGSLDAAGDAVEADVLGADVRVGVAVEPGAAARPLITPRLELSVAGAAGVDLVLAAEPVRIDLGTGAAVALPSLSATARIASTGPGRLLDGASSGGLEIAIGSLEAGLSIDPSQRPRIVLTARDAVVGATGFDVLDLSSPEALAAASEDLVAAAVSALLDGLGPAGAAVAVLIGFEAPPGASPAPPRLDLGGFLGDPLAAVAAHWRTLVADHPDTLPAILAVLRDAIASEAVRAIAIAGAGTVEQPWRVPLASGIDVLVRRDDATLAVGLEARISAADVAGSGLAATLRAGAEVAALDLANRHAAFMPAADGGLDLRAPDGAPLTLGTGAIGVSVAALGIAIRWSAGAGASCAPIAVDPSLQLAERTLPIPDLTGLAGGPSALDAAGWAAVEELLGAVAESAGGAAGIPWLGDVARLLGWAPSAGDGPTGPRLSLAALVDDPRSALSVYARALLDVATASDPLVRLADLLAVLLAGARAFPAGGGRPAAPWRVPLSAAAGPGGSALVASLAPAGPDAPPTQVSDRLRAWRPGDPGLDPASLVGELGAEAALDDELADTLEGRGDLAGGMVELLARWVGTDGLVALGENALPDGVAPYWASDRSHGAPLGSLDLEDVLGGPVPDTTVYVAVSAPGCPDVLAGDGLDAVPDARIIDLTGALPPEAIAPVAAAPGAWIVRLGGRAECRLDDGDPDGVEGQAARLQRALAPLAEAGAVIVAHGGAGHAAIRAAPDLPGLAAVVTVGTPWSAVSVDVLDHEPGAEALRLLAALLSPVDPGDPDDPDLGLGRGLVEALIGLDPLDDPLRELRPPSGLEAPPAGAAHAVVGSLGEPTARRALTAICAAALAARARARDAADPAAPELTTAGVAFPLVAGVPRGGLVAEVGIELELAELAADPSTPVRGPALVVSTKLSAGSGWLVGGPDPGRQPGVARPLALRRLTSTVRVPLREGEAGANATIILHDARAFDVSRTRWVVEVGAGAAPGATALLPEVRALLAEVAARLGPRPATDAGLDALREALAALGLLAADGGADFATIERLLFDPGATASAALVDPGRRAALASALRDLAGDGRADPADTVRVEAPAGDGQTGFVADLDLAAKSVAVAAAGRGAVPWSADVAVVAGRVAGAARLGPDLPAPGAAAADPSTPPALALLVAGPPLDARLRLRRPRRLEDVALAPAPAPGPILSAIAETAPAALLHAVLDAARATLAGSARAAAAAVEDLLDALGLLAPAPGAEGERRALRLPASLLSDPAAWLASLPAAGPAGGLATILPGVLDAIRALVGAPGAPGSLLVADGITLRAAAADGRLIGLDVDPAAFASDPGTLGLSGSVGIAAGAGGALLPDVRLSVAVPDAGAIRLGVGAAGGGPPVSLALVPARGAEIPLFPTGGGVGAIARAAGAVAEFALPRLLDAIAVHDPAAGSPASPLEVAGRVVGRLGDALGLRVDGGAAGGRHFDGDLLLAFGRDPAAALAARAAELGGALDLLEEAVGPALGAAATRTVRVDAGGLVVTAGGIEVRWLPGTARVEATVAATGVPGVDAIRAHAALDATGLVAFEAMIGPAEIAAGPLVLRPYARSIAGSGAAQPAVEVGLGAGAGERLAGRWSTRTGELSLLFVTGADGPAPIESTAPGAVAAGLLSIVAELAGSVVLELDAVREALARPLLGTTAKALLAGVMLDEGPDLRVLPGLLDPATAAHRAALLLANLAAAPGAAVTIGDALTLRPHRADAGGGDAYGLALLLAKPFPVVGDGVTVTLEEDSSWIAPSATPIPDGLAVTALVVDPTGDVTFRPELSVGGLGMRFGRSEGPLVDAGITVDSVALHFLADIRIDDAGPSLAGGARLELAGLAAPMAGASGGDNPVASGLLASGGGPAEAPKPRFSPAIAVQKHPGETTLVTLSAGPGNGPWWVVIQRGFGPLYIEQIGFEVAMDQDRIGSFGLLIDGRVSLLGLSASVDDLSISYLVAGGRSPLEPGAWRVDLAGFGVTSDVAGVTLAGGLRRFAVAAGGVEYLGLLQARLGVYGLGVYGGYGLVGAGADRYAALFLYGAIDGPIGGPPAFFVTGIAAGAGINRALTYPADLAVLGQHPFIKALDPAARPGDPMAELEAVRGFFPAQRGTFWFAAGVSFTSFALVDGVAVVAIQIGQGFELSLVGLARMALPRPQAPLASVELGLLARFSGRDGRLLVQAQLTDNSWLLYPAVRLTGGFAFATWFAGPNRGQFVLTLGGYHPSFRRPDYPSVPRLGIAWRVNSDISITGEAYFALTSEAVMAGARIQARADFGSAWASLTVGGDGIVFFDPFWLSVTVYASISAGVTVDVWIGEITISVSLSARVTLEGPPFHGRASFSVGPVDLAVEFGDRPTEPRELDWDQFVVKYLEEAATGVAHVLTTVPGRGAVPPTGDPSGGGAASPDGGDARPFRVAPEFELTVTSAAPIRELTVASTTTDLPTVPEVSAAPMRQPARPRVTLRLTGPDGDPTDRIGSLAAEAQRLGAFAIGAWGPAQSRDDPKVPRGDVLSAADRVVLRSAATVAAPTTGSAPAIAFRQVRTGPRRPLPFVVAYTDAEREKVGAGAAELASLVPPVGAEGTVPVAEELLAARGARGAADLAAWSGALAAAPLLGSLAEGLGGTIEAVPVSEVTPPEPPEPPAPRPPAVAALLEAPASSPPAAEGGDSFAATTVGADLAAKLGGQFRIAAAPAPSLASVDRGLDPATPARLLRVAPPAALGGPTVLPTGAPPASRTGRPGTETVAGRGAGPDARARLGALGDALLDGGTELADGQIALLDLPDADRDTSPDARPVLAVAAGRVRVVARASAGRVAADRVLDAANGATELVVPPGVRALACVGGAPDPGVGGDGGPLVSGWVAGTPVAYIGDEAWLGAGVAARSAGRVPARGLASPRWGWVGAERLVAEGAAVLTTFAAPVPVVAVCVEGGDPTADDIALGLDGAERVRGGDDRPAPPVVVADGPRTVAVFVVEPSAARRDGGPLTVTVATGPGRHVAGVAGALGTDPAAFAAAVAARGLADLVPAVAVDGLGRHRILWKGPG